jgi:hypothetical protein
MMKHRVLPGLLAAIGASALLFVAAPATVAQNGGPLDSLPLPVMPEQADGDAAPAQAGPQDCNPNYTPCVPNDPVDVDCADGTGDGPSFVEGPVQVIGDDVYGLDGGVKDGVGCEGGSGGGAAPTGSAPAPVIGTARFTG